MNQLILRSYTPLHHAALALPLINQGAELRTLRKSKLFNELELNSSQIEREDILQKNVRVMRTHIDTYM